MPIDFSQIDFGLQTTQKHKPTYFNRHLTGDGTNPRGLLNNSVNIFNTTPPTLYHAAKKESVKIAGVETHYIPVSPLHSSLEPGSHSLEDYSNLLESYHQDVYIDIRPLNLIVTKKPKANGQTGYDNNVYIQWEVLEYIQRDKSSDFYYSPLEVYSSDTLNHFKRHVTTDVANVLQYHTPMPSKNQVYRDSNIAKYANSYNVAQKISDLANMWTSQDIAQPTISFMESVLKDPHANINYGADYITRSLSAQMQYLENYGIPLAAYFDIHTAMQKNLDTKTRGEISKNNINLLMVDTLVKLDENRDQLKSIPKQEISDDMKSRKYSMQQIKAITATEPLTLVQSVAGSGKALANGTLIPVADKRGYVAIEDLRPGDKTFDDQGQTQTVLGVYPQGPQRAYQLNFSDNTSRICNDNHIWDARTSSQRQKGAPFQSVTLRHMMDRGIKNPDGSSNWSIPNNAPVQRPSKKLPVHPYVLGALIGDGCLSDPKRPLTISTSDELVVAKMATLMGAPSYKKLHKKNFNWNFYRNNPTPTKKYIQTREFFKWDKNHDLLGKKTLTKRIPRQYLLASYDQRLALLQGLMDTDGTVKGENNTVQYSTSNPGLVEDIQELLWSLGIRSTVTSLNRNTPRNYNTEYTIHLKMYEEDKPGVFSLRRHHETIEENYHERRFQRKYTDIIIRDVIDLGYNTPMTCIEVSGPSKLYLAGKEHHVTHNTTTIMGRIDHMVNNGIPEKDIRVLSFTNAAADNITERNKKVKSSTIASMIHDIYRHNYPTHELSTMDTLINALQIYHKNDPIARPFANQLRAFKEDSNSYTQLNLYVEQNFDDVIKLLNSVRQTTLQLEIVITYQQIENMKEPKDVACKYLIIDEVQDNSIFEFIFTLRYAIKHNLGLYLVGDSSQTLYEFRSANPKAINALEASGVFHTHQLTTNYRSNQAILDFANITLNNIEANQFAKLQLHANDLTPVTQKEFKDKVRIHHAPMGDRDTKNYLAGEFSKGPITKFVDEAISRDEQVAILAYKRDHIIKAQEVLERRYPNHTHLNITPERAYESNVISTFISKFWDEIEIVPAKDAPLTVIKLIDQRLDQLVKWSNDKVRNAVEDTLTSWWATQGPSIQAHAKSVALGNKSHKDFMDILKDSLINYEIKNNAVRRSVINARNQESKEDSHIDKDFVYSTIHSVKGLEFPNVIVVYYNEEPMAEDKKRLYYVAMTRAMNKELILSYGLQKNPKIVADHDNLAASYPTS